MFKKALVIAIMSLALSSFGCAHIQEFVGEYIPTVEAKAGAAGFSLKIDPKLGVDAFCLDPIGTAAGILAEIPIIGNFTAEFVGLCEQDAAEPAVE